MWKKVSNTELEKFLTAARDVAKLQELPNFQAILRGLNSQIVQRSRGCRVSRFRTYRDNLWTFRVNCSGTTYTVWLHAEDTDRNPKTLPEIKIKCTCPHWKWGGPDYNANAGRYLYEKPFSNVSFPDQRDPTLQNKLCKHAFAVLDKARDFIIFESQEQERKRVRDEDRTQKVEDDREQRRQKQELRRQEQDQRKQEVQKQKHLRDTERRRKQDLHNKDLQDKRDQRKREQEEKRKKPKEEQENVFNK